MIILCEERLILLKAIVVSFENYREIIKQIPKIIADFEKLESKYRTIKEISYF
jgi:hypothetical protein